MSVSVFFSQAAQWTSKQCGKPLTFGLAALIIIVWGVSGPIFNFSDTWQLVINTGTTIVTFLMVFLIQNTQNRDSAAVQLKLDELIRVSESARNSLLSLENMTDAQIETIRESFANVAERGGVGEGQLHDAEEDLQEAASKIKEARVHLTPRRK
ncbi:MAG: low affinity iron permease family protein [Alphaproteobacteria bacterium]|nr:low affinity iron permease family protein [Alphaproteobacteria bacterium]